MRSNETKRKKTKQKKRETKEGSEEDKEDKKSICLHFRWCKSAERVSEGQVGGAGRGWASAYVRVTPVCMILRPPLSKPEDRENESAKSYKHARRHTYTQRTGGKNDAGGKKNEPTTVWQPYTHNTETPIHMHAYTRFCKFFFLGLF